MLGVFVHMWLVGRMDTYFTEWRWIQLVLEITILAMLFLLFSPWLAIIIVAIDLISQAQIFCMLQCIRAWLNYKELKIKQGLKRIQSGKMLEIQAGEARGPATGYRLTAHANASVSIKDVIAKLETELSELKDAYFDFNDKFGEYL